MNEGQPLLSLEPQYETIEEKDHENQSLENKKPMTFIQIIYTYGKNVLLLAIFFTFCIFFGISFETVKESNVSISKSTPLYKNIPLNTQKSKIMVDLTVYLDDQTEYLHQEFPEEVDIFVYLQCEYSPGVYNTTITDSLNITRTNFTGEVYKRFLFNYPNQRADARILFNTDSEIAIPLSIMVQQQTFLIDHELVTSVLILIFIYGLIIFNITSRPLAALLGAFISISVLSIIENRPTMADMMSYVIWDAIGLIVGMMITFGILRSTGIFEWSAIKAYKLSRGNVWLLTIILSTFCFVASLLLDKITLMLLMTPITVQLCQVIGISPVPLLLMECFYANLGGIGTPLGEEIIIGLQHPRISSFQINFFKTFGIFLPVAILCGIVVFPIFLIFFRKSLTKKPKDNSEALQKKRQIQIWRRTLTSLDGGEAEKEVQETLSNYIESLEGELKVTKSDEDINIQKLEEKYQIHNKLLFVRSGIVLIIVFLLFFIDSFISKWIRFSLPWISLMGAITSLIISGNHNIEHVLQDYIEWPTIVYFISLFIINESMQKLGIIDVVAKLIESMINPVAEKYRLLVAITSLLWISGFISMVIDNIPYMTAMIPVIVKLSEAPLSLPLEPLLFALNFGVCIGGAATIIGASSNVIAVDVASKKGVDITFFEFVRISIVGSIISMLICWIYLVILYIAIGIQ